MLLATPSTCHNPQRCSEICLGISIWPHSPFFPDFSSEWVQTLKWNVRNWAGCPMHVSCHWSSKLECLFSFFYPFGDWKLYHDDMHVLVWLCASWCATFLYQTHLRACCVPGSRLSAFCGLLLILIIAFQGKYFHHRMEKPRLRNHIVSKLCSMNLKAALSSPKPGPFH